MVYNPLKKMVGNYRHGTINEPVLLTQHPGGHQLKVDLVKLQKLHQLDITYSVLQYFSSPKGHKMNIIHS